MKSIQPISFILVLATIVLCLSCNKDDEGDNGNNVSSIEFKVTSQDSGKTVDIEYDIEGMNSVNIDNQTLPWSVNHSKKLEVGDDINITVTSASSGIMKAEILIDGEVVESESDDNLIVLLYVHGL